MLRPSQLVLNPKSTCSICRRAGTIFQQGVKVKNHLFDITEVSIFWSQSQILGGQLTSWRGFPVPLSICHGVAEQPTGFDLCCNSDSCINKLCGHRVRPTRYAPARVRETNFIGQLFLNLQQLCYQSLAQSNTTYLQILLFLRLFALDLQANTCQTSHVTSLYQVWSSKAFSLRRYDALPVSALAELVTLTCDLLHWNSCAHYCPLDEQPSCQFLCF